MVENEINFWIIWCWSEIKKSFNEKIWIDYVNFDD